MIDCETSLKKTALLREQGCNCAQAVALTFAELLPVDEQTLFKATEGFGSGMGGTDGTCGALSGAILVLSMLSSSGSTDRITKKETYAQGKRIFDDFVAIAGSSVCRDLQGLDTGEALHTCPACIEDAVKLVCRELENPVRQRT